MNYQIVSMKILGVCSLLVSGAVIGCAGVSPRTTAAKSDAVPAAAGAAENSVRAVQLESPTSEGQTTWRIEPVASWVPRELSRADGGSPHIEQRLRYAFDLGQRGASYSAHTEFRAVLALCALELDAREGSRAHRTAVSEAFTALGEADDFAAVREDLGQPADVAMIAASHTTRRHFSDGDHESDPLSAVQAYYAFAEKRLRLACGDLPSASSALYGLGRIEPLLDGNDALAAPRAVLFFRTALAVDEHNTLAANELGVLLVQHGQLAQAERVLDRAAAMGSSSPSVQHNLAVVTRRLRNGVASELQPTDRAELARQRPHGFDQRAEQSLPAAEGLAASNEYDGLPATAAESRSDVRLPASSRARGPWTFRTASKRLSRLTDVLRR